MVSIIRDPKNEDNVIDADFHSHMSHLPDSNILLAVSALWQLFNSGDIAESDVKNFTILCVDSTLTGEKLV